MLKVLLSPRLVFQSVQLALQMMRGENAPGVGKKKIILVHPYFGLGVDEGNQRWIKYIEGATRIINDYERITALVVFPGPMIEKGDHAGNSEGMMVYRSILTCMNQLGYKDTAKFESSSMICHWQRGCSTEADVRAFFQQVIISLSSEGEGVNFDQYQIIQICNRQHAKKCRRLIWNLTGQLPLQKTYQVITNREAVVQIFLASPLATLSMILPFFYFWKMAYRRIFQGIG